MENAVKSTEDKSRSLHAHVGWQQRFVVPHEVRAISEESQMRTTGSPDF